MSNENNNIRTETTKNIFSDMSYSSMEHENVENDEIECITMSLTKHADASLPSSCA